MWRSISTLLFVVQRFAVKLVIKLLTLFSLVISLVYPVRADVVKPALIEITASTTNEVEIEIRASIEALLTGINGRYTNTTEAPTAEQYDYLRELDSAALTRRFTEFYPVLLDGVRLTTGQDQVLLSVDRVEIPPPGYTKVPRNSVIYLSGTLDRQASELVWYYPAKFGDHATRVRQVDPAQDLWHWSSHQWIKEDVPTQPYDLTAVFTKPTVLDLAKTYIGSGFNHIIPAGLDHIVFVIGLFLFSSKWRPLIWQVTMFTAAHSITLALGMLNWINLPSSLVEPLIALSIAYIAFENIFSKGLSRYRLQWVFAFGLLHGLGFASVLNEFGMPREAFGLALAFFNVGVEIGQLAVIAACFVLVRVWFKSEVLYRTWVVLPGSALIGMVGLYWLVDRLDFQQLLNLA